MVGGEPFAVNRPRRRNRDETRGRLAASGRPYLPTYTDCTSEQRFALFNLESRETRKKMVFLVGNKLQRRNFESHFPLSENWNRKVFRHPASLIKFFNKKESMSLVRIRNVGDFFDFTANYVSWTIRLFRFRTLLIHLISSCRSPAYNPVSHLSLRPIASGFKVRG